MNKNDFEILSPTYKQKTEMKERLMKEAVKEESKPFWQDFSFYVKIAASLVLVVGVVAIIGLIINSNGTGVDILLPPVSKPVISDISSESEDFPSDTSSEKESGTESEPPVSDIISNDSTASSESHPDALKAPYISDIGSFDRSGVLNKKPVIENEKLKVEVNDLYYEKETLILSYSVTNKGSEELDIGTFTAGMGDYSDVFINGYGLLNEDTYSENITAQLSKKKLSQGDTAEVTIEARYDALLAIGINSVSEIRTALYYGKRWNEDEVDFKEYETVYIEARTSLYDEVGTPAISYEEQLKNEAVQEKTGYTFLQFIGTPFDEQKGIVIENAALLKTKSDTDGMEHYTVRLTIHNASDNTVKFYTAVYLVNDVLTAMVGANHPGNDIPADGRLILDVNTRSLGDLSHYGITDIRKIRLNSRTGAHNSELEEFSTDIKFSEDTQSESKQELYNGNGVIITAEELYEQCECGNIALLFDTANSIKTFSFTGNACTINGKEFVIGQSTDEIRVGSAAWDTPTEGSVRKPFVLSIPMELYDEIGIASASEIEEIAVELTIYKADGSTEKPIITIRP